MNQPKRKFIPRSLAGIAVATLLTSQASAQIHMPVHPYNQALVLAEEQYQQGHYRMAIQSARQYLGTSLQPTAINTLTDVEKAQYYLALSQLKLDNDGCTDSATAFITKTANPVYQQRTAFALAQYYFRHEQLAKAHNCACS